MNKRIRFLKKENIVNENGFSEEKLVQVKKAWASISNLSGKEYFAAAAIQQEHLIKIKIRYSKSISKLIDESMIIEFQKAKYEIVFIGNIKYENRFIEIKAKVI